MTKPILGIILTENDQIFGHDLNNQSKKDRKMVQDILLPEFVFNWNKFI